MIDSTYMEKENITYMLPAEQAGQYDDKKHEFQIRLPQI